MRRIACFVLSLSLLTASCTSLPKTPPPQPFQLTQQEEQSVDHLLVRWEKWNAGVKTYDCKVKRWTYSDVFGRPDEAAFVELGTIKYAAPDHCLFKIDTAEKNDLAVPSDSRRAEHWVFDGKSITEFNHTKRQVIEYKLPAKSQASQFLSGPLTFPPSAIVGLLFGFGASDLPSPLPFSAKAKDLKEQYYLREFAPPTEAKDQVMLEAYPRSAQLAACLQKLQLIFNAKNMSPYAMRIVQPNGRDSVVYQFYDAAVNAKPSSDDDPFHPAVPQGWQKIAEDPRPGLSLLDPHIGAP
jgi:TIGR03009 family protein